MRKITADILFPMNQSPINNGVLVLNDAGAIEAILPSADGLTGVEVLEGYLAPGFINSHCHLELSHLHNVLPEHTGIVDFILGVQTKRNSFSEQEIIAAALKADAQMQAQGIVAVGDIANSTFSFATKKDSPILYHTFFEVIGFNRERAEQIISDALQMQAAASLSNSSITPHAPYSVSSKLMELINGLPNNQTISIHNQESAAENIFMQTASGDFTRLYEKFGIDISHFKAGFDSSLAAYIRLFQSKKMGLVHNTFMSPSDMELAKNSGNEIYYVICANANLFIENKLPDIAFLQAAGANICLGTDSLASNHSLSMLSEINTIRAANPQIPLAELLQWATLNGAAFLGLEQQFGAFKIGTKPGINLIAKDLKSLQVIASA
jgi:cytosine/adenosine deaminase-related metal-dependent hydrolase